MEYLDFESLTNDLKNINTQQKYWMIRTMGGSYYGDFIRNNYVAVGYNEVTLELLRRLPETEAAAKTELKALFIRQFPNIPNTGYPVAQLLRFTREIHQGDIVIIPSTNATHVAIGIDALRLIIGERQTVSVPVPAGAVDGGRVRLKRRGEYGANGGERGDLLVITHVEQHPLFKRDGADVTMTLPVSVYEAALGCEIEVPTPGGGTVRLKIPAGTQSGKTFRFREMGAPDVKRRGRTGALLVKIEVRTPDRLSDDERAALEKLRDADHRDYRANVDRYRAKM